MVKGFVCGRDDMASKPKDEESPVKGSQKKESSK
jgi:hypothetical protein